MTHGYIYLRPTFLGPEIFYMSPLREATFTIIKLALRVGIHLILHEQGLLSMFCAAVILIGEKQGGFFLIIAIVDTGLMTVGLLISEIYTFICVAAMFFKMAAKMAS